MIFEYISRQKYDFFFFTLTLYTDAEQNKLIFPIYSINQNDRCILQFQKLFSYKVFLLADISSRNKIIYSIKATYPSFIQIVIAFMSQITSVSV